MENVPDLEGAGLLHRTKELGDFARFHDRLANVVAIIRTHFIQDDEWSTHADVGWGSITIRNRTTHQVIKVFIDDNSRLVEGKFHLNLKGTQITVGVELTHLSAQECDLVRNWLSEKFGARYMDVRAGKPRICLGPQVNHHYDIVFPEDGLRGLEPDANMLLDTRRIIAAASV